MNKIKEMVSGKRIRLKNQNFNLDLSYITNRIIGMSFPASGFEKIYRNNIKEVGEFLNNKHKNSYIIINVSNRKIKYKEENFENNDVLDFLWENHKPPSFPLLFKILNKVYKFYNLNNNNIIIVNCLSGKGRTGTIICAILLFLGITKTVEESNDLFFKERGVPITHPSQLRYLGYFFKVLNNIENINEIVWNNENIKILKLNFIYFKGFLNNIGINNSLMIKIKLRYEEYSEIFKKEIVLKNYQIKNKNNEFKIEFDNIFLIKDFGIEIYENGIINKNKILLTYHNCDFIQNENIKLDYRNIDPYELYSKNKIKPDFEMDWNFTFNMIKKDQSKLNENFYFKSIKKCLDLVNK